MKTKPNMKWSEWKLFDRIFYAVLVPNSLSTAPCWLIHSVQDCGTWSNLGLSSTR